MSANPPEFLFEIYQEIGDLYMQSRLNVLHLYQAYLSQILKQLEVDIHANRWAVSEFFANYAQTFEIEIQNENLLKKRRNCWKRFCVARLWELHGGGNGSSESEHQENDTGNERKKEILNALLIMLKRTWSEVVAVEMQRKEKRLVMMNVSEHTTNTNDAAKMESTFTNTGAATPAPLVPIANPTATTTASPRSYTNSSTNKSNLTKLLWQIWSLALSILKVIIYISNCLITLSVNVLSHFPLLVLLMVALMLLMSPLWIWHETVGWFGKKSSGWTEGMKSWFKIWDSLVDSDSDAGANEDENEGTYHNAGYDSYNWTSSFNYNESFVPSLLPQIENLQNVLRDLTKQWSKLQLSTTSTNIYNSEDPNNLDHINRFRKYSDALMIAGTTSTNTLRLILKDANRTLNKLERIIDRRLMLPRNCMVAFWQGSEEMPCISVSEWERVWMGTLAILGLGMIGIGIWSRCHRRSSSSSRKCLLFGGFVILGFPFLELVTLYQRSPSSILAHSTYSLQETLSSYHTIQTSKIPSLLDLFTDITSCIRDVGTETMELHGVQQRLLHTTQKRDKELGASLWTWMPKKMTSRRYMEEVRVIKKNERTFRDLERKADDLFIEGDRVGKIIRRGEAWLNGIESMGIIGEKRVVVDIKGGNKAEDGIGNDEVEELGELKREIDWIREILYRLGQMVK